MNELETDKVVTRSYCFKQLDHITSQNVLSTIVVRLLCSQYDHLVFGTMALRLISGNDGFSKFLSRFKILRGHLDQTRPNSSSNVRKQISCVATTTTPFSRRSSPFCSNFWDVLRTSISVTGV